MRRKNLIRAIIRAAENLLLSRALLQYISVFTTEKNLSNVHFVIGKSLIRVPVTG